MVGLAEVRLNVACPEPLLQADKLVGIAVGPGVTINCTATGCESQKPSLTTAYTVVFPATKSAGLATGLVAAIFVYHITGLPDPPLTTPFKLNKLNVACPPPISQPDRLVGNAIGAGTTFSTTAAGWDVQPFMVTVA